MENLNENTDKNTLPEEFVNKYTDTSKEDLINQLYKAENKIVKQKKADKEVKQEQSANIDVNSLKSELLNEIKKENFYNSNEVSDQAQNAIEAMVSTGAFTREDAYNLVTSEEKRKQENIAKTNAMKTPNSAGVSEKTSYTRDEIMTLSTAERNGIMEKIEQGAVTLTE